MPSCLHANPAESCVYFSVRQAIGIPKVVVLALDGRVCLNHIDRHLEDSSFATCITVSPIRRTGPEESRWKNDPTYRLRCALLIDRQQDAILETSPNFEVKAVREARGHGPGAERPVFDKEHACCCIEAMTILCDWIPGKLPSYPTA
jgi:hypothetical protein